MQKLALTIAAAAAIAITAVPISPTALAATAMAARAQPPSAVMRYFQVPATTTHPAVVVPVEFLSVLTPRPSVGVILFAGGKGKINFNSSGVPAPALNADNTLNKDSLENNFLVRTRSLFAGKGVTVAVVDWGPIGGVTEDQRLSQAHADIISWLIESIRKEPMYQVSRVWLVGTSSGTLSVLNTAARYPLRTVDADSPGAAAINNGRPNGIVLTSTQTVVYSSSATSCARTIDDVTPKPAAINVPALVVWNLTDACGCSPGSATGGPGGSNAALSVVSKLGSKFGGPARTGKAFNGPAAPGDQCRALTPHGFNMIENEVVTYIVNLVSPPPPTSNAPF